MNMESSPVFHGGTLLLAAPGFHTVYAKEYGISRPDA
jgi:hypothetical protein